jgi:hypothetical protein
MVGASKFGSAETFRCLARDRTVKHEVETQRLHSTPTLSILNAKRGTLSLAPRATSFNQGEVRRRSQPATGGSLTDPMIAVMPVATFVGSQPMSFAQARRRDKISRFREELSPTLDGGVG